MAALTGFEYEMSGLEAVQEVAADVRRRTHPVKGPMNRCRQLGGFTQPSVLQRADEGRSGTGLRRLCPAANRQALVAAFDQAAVTEEVEQFLVGVRVESELDP